MEPTLHDGEWWIALRTTRVRPGQIVVIEQPEQPGLLAVKRLIRRDADGWWVEGDNPSMSRDSRDFGALPDSRIVGRLLLRYRSARRRG